MATYWENSCSFGLRYVSWYKYLIASLVFSHLGFWSGNLFLIAPFPDLCLLVPFSDCIFITNTCPCNIQRLFSPVKIKNFIIKIDIFVIFAQNIDCGYTLEPPRRGSNEYPQFMFWSKNKKTGIPLHIPVLLHVCKSGVQWGIHYADMFS